jgi:hypothetical protein
MQELETDLNETATRPQKARPEHPEPTKLLLTWQEKLRRVENLITHVEKELDAIGVYGEKSEDWKNSCEQKALTAINAAIAQDRNLPVSEDKLRRIPEDAGKGHYTTGYGRWLKAMSPEMLQAWITKNIGDPEETEVNLTINEAFPAWLRDKERVFDDSKSVIRRHVTSFDTRYGGKHYLSYSFNAKPWLAFIQLAQSLQENIPFSETEIPVIELLDTVTRREWERSQLFRKHEIGPDCAVTAIRPLIDGTWCFHLKDKAYLALKILGQQNFAKAVNQS